jgi:hypothetical protein
MSVKSSNLWQPSLPFEGNVRDKHFKPGADE